MVETHAQSLRGGLLNVFKNIHIFSLFSQEILFIALYHNIRKEEEGTNDMFSTRITPQKCIVVSRE